MLLLGHLLLRRPARGRWADGLVPLSPRTLLRELTLIRWDNDTRGDEVLVLVMLRCNRASCEPCRYSYLVCSESLSHLMHAPCEEGSDDSTVVFKMGIKGWWGWEKYDGKGIANAILWRICVGNLLSCYLFIFIINLESLCFLASRLWG